MPTFTSDERKILVRHASTLPSGSEGRKAVLAGLSLTTKTAAGYTRKSMRGGDYGGAGSSKQLVKDMIANMQRVKTPAERSHAVEQVQHAEAAKSITSQQAKEVTKAIGKTASARRAGSRTAARRLYVVDRKKGVVLQFAPDRGSGEEDLWLWIDEVSDESRKTLTVMSGKAVLNKWGKIKWAPKRRQDPGGVDEEHQRLLREVRRLREGVSRTAEDWMEDAVKRPGRLHKFFGIPEDETIPMSKIDGEIAKLKKKDDRTKDEESLLAALNLGKTFKEMKKSATTPSDDRIALIRYASTLPVGSGERKAILSALPKSAYRPLRADEMEAQWEFTGSGNTGWYGLSAKIAVPLGDNPRHKMDAFVNALQRQIPLGQHSRPKEEDTGGDKRISFYLQIDPKPAGSRVTGDGKEWETSDYRQFEKILVKMVEKAAHQAKISNVVWW